MVGEIRFVVEQAGCPTCAGRIRGALAAITSVLEVKVDEKADVAFVRLAKNDSVSEGAIAAALDAVSVGAGHAYRVQPGTLLRTN